MLLVVLRLSPNTLLAVGNYFEEESSATHPEPEIVKSSQSRMDAGRKRVNEEYRETYQCNPRRY